jgi:hypothetical protein
VIIDADEDRLQTIEETDLDRGLVYGDGHPHPAMCEFAPATRTCWFRATGSDQDDILAATAAKRCRGRSHGDHDRGSRLQWVLRRVGSRRAAPPPQSDSPSPERQRVRRARQRRWPDTGPLRRARAPSSHRR